MFSLTLTPTALIGLNEKLKIPKNFSMKCAARPSLFAYPEPLQPPKKEEEKIAATTVLSTAAKAKTLKEKKDKEAEEAKVSGAGDKPAGTLADMVVDDKASVGGSVLDAGSVVGQNISVAATPGTTVVGSVADSVAASDLGSEMMEIDEPTASPPASAQGEATSAGADALPGRRRKRAATKRRRKKAKRKRIKRSRSHLRKSSRTHAGCCPSRSSSSPSRRRSMGSLRGTRRFSRGANWVSCCSTTLGQTRRRTSSSKMTNPRAKTMRRSQIRQHHLSGLTTSDCVRLEFTLVGPSHGGFALSLSLYRCPASSNR